MVRVVVIDTETTGLKPHEGGNRIIELAAMEIVDGEITGNSYRSYVNPQGRKSNPLALKVHQIQDDFLLDKPTFKELSDDFLEFIEGAELCSYNAAFDFGFLQAEVDRAGIDIVFSRDYKISCLMEDIKYKLGLKRWLKLDSACLRYGIDISTRKVHGALIDAMLAAELFIAFHYQNTKPLDKTPQQKPHSPPEPRPIPRAYKHPLTGQMIQLNYCKNPQCSNYGIPAKNPELDKHGKPKRGLANDYKLTNSAIGKSLTCKRCNTSTRMINNRSFVLESLRNAEEFSLKEPCCPNTGMDADAERGIPNGVRYKCSGQVKLATVL